MKNGRFIGVGIGPGDPGLVTVRAIEVIQQAAVICLPRSRNKEESIAYGIIQSYCRDAHCIEMAYSMAHERRNREHYWKKHAETICRLCEQGLCVVFVTLGDPCLYSTFAYVAQLVCGLQPATVIEIVPGVTSIAASAASAGISLAQAEESFLVLPCTQVLNKDAAWWESFDCVVVMKIGSKLPDLIKRLDHCLLLPKTVLVTRAGFDNCTIIRGMSLVDCTIEQGYLATMLVYAKSEQLSERTVR